MKVNKQITIDEDLAEELQKEMNASKLINDLLRDYFNVGGSLKKIEIKNKITEKEMQINNLNEEINILKGKLEAIEKKEKMLKEVFKNIPDEVLEDFKSFGEKINYLSRFNEIWGKKYDVKLEEVEKAYKFYFNKQDD